MDCPRCEGTGDSHEPGDGGCEKCRGTGVLCEVCGESCQPAPKGSEINICERCEMDIEDQDDWPEWEDEPEQGA